MKLLKRVSSYYHPELSTDMTYTLRLDMAQPALIHLDSSRSSAPSLIHALVGKFRTR